MRRRRCAIATAALLVLGKGGAGPRAQPPGDDVATPHFERGARQYSKGDFSTAIAEFEKAYEVAPSPILLFNIAQCHRHLGNQERALFFYRRYLEQRPKAVNRAEVERRIAELEQGLESEREANERLEAGRSTRAPTAVADAAGGPDPGASPRWTAAAYGAPALIAFTNRDLDSGAVLFSATVAIGYRLPVRGPELRVGATGSLTLLPFVNEGTAARDTSALWGFLVTGSCLYPVTPRLKVGGGAGVGVIWWSGLVTGNPFTVDGAASTGPVPLPTLALGGRLEYGLGKGLFLAFAPDVLFSKTTSAGLAGAVSWVRRLDLSVGAGYAF
jgi:hypothetical protein